VHNRDAAGAVLHNHTFLGITLAITENLLNTDKQLKYQTEITRQTRLTLATDNLCPVPSSDCKQQSILYVSNR